MNKRFLSMSLAGLLAFAAIFTGIAPANLLDNDVSVVSATNNRVSFEKSSYDLKIGESAYPMLDDVVIDGVRLTRANLEWTISYSYNSSSDTTAPVITVGTDGKITAVAEGYASVKAQYKSTTGRTYTGYIYVDVEDPNAEQIDNKYARIYLEVGSTLTPQNLIKMKNGSQFTIESVNFDDAEAKTEGDVKKGLHASVDLKTGVLTAISAGYIDRYDYQVTVKTTDGKTSDGWYPTIIIVDKPGTSAQAQEGTGTFTVTNNKEVTFTAPSVASNGVIPNNVTINGISYKVTAVADNAFKGNTAIKTVRIPAATTTIGANAFNGCKNLKSVDLAGTDVKTIGAGAFSGCKKLTEITINGDVTTTFGKNAFKGIPKKATIYVETASNAAFKKIVKKMKKAGAKCKFVEL